MKLLIDIGNSRLKWACYRDNVLTPATSVAYTLESLPTLLPSQWQHLPTPAAVGIANVAAPEVQKILSTWIEKQWHYQPFIAKTMQNACGVHNSYRHPTQLGVDRWLMLLAARAWTTNAVCIVGCGTAITLDILDKTGKHQGGLISAGLHTMKHALLQETYALARTPPTRDPHSPLPLLATDTQTGIELGILYAAAGLIEYAFQRFHSLNPLLLITGGDAQTLSPLLKPPHHYIPDLVLRGLAVNMNTPS